MSKIWGVNSVYTLQIQFDLGPKGKKSYIATKLVKLIKPKLIGQKQISYSSFGGEGTSKSTTRSVYDLDLMSSTGAPHKISLIEVPVICASITRSRLPDNLLQHFKDLPLADTHD